jgi:hypothetical protein
MTGVRRPYTILATVAAAAFASALVTGQEVFQFVVSASDEKGNPVTDLATKDVVMSENGTPNEIVKVEPYHVPVKLTIAVDNGSQSRDALSAYRSGLEGMVKALPAEVEIELITTSPQPRRVVPATTDRERIFRGINGFAPEDERPRFTDALVEFSRKYQQEIEKTKRIDSLPILVLISTTENEQSSYEVPEITKALQFLQGRKARVYVAIHASRGNVADASQLNDNRQAQIGIPAAKATNGKFETLAIYTRLTTLLPEWGEEIAALHRKYYNQTLVTAARAKGITGPLQNPRIELARPGLTGAVSLDGLP